MADYNEFVRFIIGTGFRYFVNTSVVAEYIVSEKL
jgi:hypothetical protein